VAARFTLTKVEARGGVPVAFEATVTYYNRSVIAPRVVCVVKAAIAVVVAVSGVAFRVALGFPASDTCYNTYMSVATRIAIQKKQCSDSVSTNALSLG
jgi:hypothetical protein